MSVLLKQFGMSLEDHGSKINTNVELYSEHNGNTEIVDSAKIFGAGVPESEK